MLAGSLRGRFSCFCEKIDKKQPQGGADRCLLPPQSRGIYGAIATGNRLFRIRCAEHHPTLRILPARHYGPGENPHADVANNNAVQGCAIVWGAIRVRWGDTIPDDADTWKAYLAAQAAAGTPVQVAYKLATPTHIMATGNGSIMPIPGETNTIMTDADRVTVTGRADPIRIIQQLQAQLATATQQLDETQQEVVDTTAMTVDYIYQQDLAEIGLEEVDDSDNQTDTGAADVPGV